MGQTPNSKLCENIFRWADSRVLDATPLLDMHKAFLFPHPLTQGHAPPFFLLTYSRYLMEDVVFICEYQTRDPDPIYKSANWRKNGRPLTSNDDRIQINVTVNQVGNSELYNVLSILTIQFLEDQDFGSYTCDYHNPFNSEVQPGPSMTSEFRYKSENDIPIPPPDSECNCKPKTTNPDQCTNQPIIIPVQCFSEFLLNKRNEQVLTKMISPGSLFIEGAFYSTVSESENIGVELSISESKDQDQNCCSWFVRTYWRFFRKGGFLSENPPYTRTIITEYGLYFLRYQCMCKSSYGMSEFRIFRNFINTTSGRGDRAEIVYPVRHKLFPVYTDPWSSNQSEADENIYHDTHSCFESDFSSEECWVHEQLFESNLKRMISYEFGLTFALMLVTTLIAVLFYYSVMKGCIRPLLTFVLYGDIRETTFEAVNGKSLTKFRPRRRHKARIAPDVQRQQYDIYLSYDSENEFDSMIAEHIKGILVSLKLTYFDSQTDVRYGHLILTEQEKAIANSLRYVCIASQSYIDHNSVEFNAIQLAIVGQNSKLKDRLLIIKSEDCDVERLYLIPCISVPEEARARSVLTERNVRDFFKWEKSTSVHELACKSDKLTAIKGILGLKTMTRPLIILMAQMFIICIDTFTLNS
ncbi:hypothetical protein BgiBS90_005045 [Biomphalaria glabrata]|nr:hypothetical protein BgiBS90_005045 [Biomphalaria glabrata]